jgi:uncharacterized protein (TIGR03118 family)
LEVEEEPMKTPAAVASLVLSLLATSALAAPRVLSDAQLGQIVAGDDFTVTLEVGDNTTDCPTCDAAHIDPLLSNPWGLAQAPGTFLWVSDNNSGFTTLYDPTSGFGKVPLNVQIRDGAADPNAIASPSGTVFTDFGASGVSTFDVQPGNPGSHAFFLFDTEDGTIQGWAPGVDFFHTEIAVDDSSTGASFKGLALIDDPIAGSAGATLYAADLANNRVDIFNDQFQAKGSFTDPNLPKGFGPFNVQALNGKVYVTFAEMNPADTEGLPRPGAGFVDVYDPATGTLTRLISGNHLNAPWGLDIAPANFGQFAGDLLVGNFGDGQVHAYNPVTGAFVGTVDLSKMANGGPGAFQFTDLWALRNGPDGEVIFSAGLANQGGGVLGVIKPSFAAASWAFQSHVQLGH